MINKAKVSDAYGITVEVEGEAGYMELLAAAGAEFERLTGLVGKPKTTAGAGFTTQTAQATARPSVPDRRPKAGHIE